MDDTKRPELRITGLHIRGLKSIQALDLPEDGLFWEGKVPPFIVVGGVNGSGKTTLLELIYGALAGLGGRPGPGSFGANWWIDFVLSDGEKPVEFRSIGGSEAFIAEHALTNMSAWNSQGYGLASREPKNKVPTLQQRLLGIELFWRTKLPSVVYLPADRVLGVPPTEFKRAGRLVRATRFANRWEPAGDDWNQSLEARLYSARWADLNAKEKGHPEEAVHFAAYADAFREMTEGSRTLDWTVDGDLIVVTSSGATHGLLGLSAGEQQVLVLTAELLWRWRPGSLILIDEPELHLHTHWQAKLLSMLERFQEQRGGQVILATQSADLWRFASAHGRVLLGGKL